MFDFAVYLKERRALIDSALNAKIPGEDVPPTLLHKAMRYSVFSGGKRLRPITCLAAAEAAGASLAGVGSDAGKAFEDAMFPAVAVELLHTYTLIHDDLPCMDDDDLRRGKPTCHVVFGEANAILAGDALQTLAFEVLARAHVPPPYPPNQLVAELAHAAGSLGVVGGQVEDIAAGESKPKYKTRRTIATKRHKTHKNLNAEVVEYIHLHKTADLFRSAVRMGGIAGSARKEELEALTEYGINLGLAFQIADDLLDADSKRDKMTCLSVYGPESARKRGETLVNKAISAVGKLDRTRTEPLSAIARYVIERKV